MKKVHVNASAPYDVFIGPRLLQETGKLLKSVCNSNRLIIVTDDIVDGFYGEALKKALEEENFSVLKCVIPNGEKVKNFSTLEKMLNFFAKNGVRRNNTVLALGGGVVGDLAGFAAAIYQRGVDVVQIPTTLLAMVDSAVGGKTGIDLPMGKNLVGAFHQPKLVIADTETLQTLPPQQFAADMGEVIKYGIIGKNDILDTLEKQDMEELISACISFKRDIVEQDERDCLGIREILNAGHTVGHAIEKLSCYTVPHGKAVAMGLVVEARMAVDLEFAEMPVYDRIFSAVKSCGLYEKLPYSAAELAEAMRSDKKNSGKEIAFILPVEIGKCMRKDLTVEQVTELLKEQ